jgi:large subunit ribosomal protein L17
MRHGNYKYRLSVSPSHRKALLKNLCFELFDHGKVKTTITKAKALKPFAEKLITIAKVDTLANRRLAYAKLNNKDAVKALFDNVAPKFKQRPGGYTRVLRFSDARLGDAAKMAYICLVD